MVVHQITARVLENIIVGGGEAGGSARVGVRRTW
jgi:hypothetical protein